MQKKNNSNAYENKKLELVINGHVVKDQLKNIKQGKFEISNLGQYFKEGKQKVTVRFNNESTRLPYELRVNWNTSSPISSKKCNVALQTHINAYDSYKVGDLVRFTTTVTNIKNEGIPMTTAIIGIPSGTSPQPWQLKELITKEKVAYYEVFDNFLVFYWRSLKPNETKKIALDLKAEIAGNYQAPASCVYLYYTDEHRNWELGTNIVINP